MTRPTMGQTSFPRTITSELEVLYRCFLLQSWLYSAGCSADIERINPKGWNFLSLSQPIQIRINNHYTNLRLYVMSVTLVNLCPDHSTFAVALWYT